MTTPCQGKDQSILNSIFLYKVINTIICMMVAYGQRCECIKTKHPQTLLFPLVFLHRGNNQFKKELSKFIYEHNALNNTRYRDGYKNPLKHRHIRTDLRKDNEDTAQL
jgi:hypothetical protein